MLYEELKKELEKTKQENNYLQGKLNFDEEEDDDGDKEEEEKGESVG